MDVGTPGPVTARTAAQTTRRPEGPCGTGLILVVDDEPMIAETLCLVLEADGYGCTTAADGQQALESLARSSPSVILLDLMMPVLDGRDFLQRLRSEHRWERIPVIVMTAAPALGGDGELPRHEAFLRKPFELDRLLAEVHRLTAAGARPR